MNTSDSLVHDLEMQDDYETRNYPPEGDTTSEGGSITSAPLPAQPRPSNPAQQFSPSNPPSNPSSGPNLIDQSPDGGPLSSSELQDAAQGFDRRARAAFAHAAERDFGARSPCKHDPNQNSDADADWAGEAKEREAWEAWEAGEPLASAYLDAREREFESGPAGEDGEDVGAF